MRDFNRLARAAAALLAMASGYLCVKHNEQDPGFCFIKLSPRAIVTGSLIAPLKALTVSQWAQLHVALQLASEEAMVMNPSGALWPLGEVLALLGFTVEEAKAGEPGEGNRLP